MGDVGGVCFPPIEEREHGPQVSVEARSFSGGGFPVGSPGQRAGGLPYKDFEKETPVAVVYHLDFGDPNRFGQMLTNISNHLSVYDNDPFKVPGPAWVRIMPPCGFSSSAT